MSNTSQYYIPKYLDEPFRIIIFTVDEFLVTFIPMALICIVCNELLGIATGVAIYGFYIKYKKKEGSAYLKRVVYWMYGLGGCVLTLRLMPKHNNKKLKG